MPEDVWILLCPSLTLHPVWRDPIPELLADHHCTVLVVLSYCIHRNGSSFCSLISYFIFFTLYHSTEKIFCQEYVIYTEDKRANYKQCCNNILICFPIFLSNIFSEARLVIRNSFIQLYKEIQIILECLY